MSRVHDVGGMDGFPAAEPTVDEPPFGADWEARVFALNRVLIAHDIYDLDEFRAAVEAIEPARYMTMSYYERWLTAIEMLAAQRGIRVVPVAPHDAA
jgi:nitrile hydratase